MDIRYKEEWGLQSVNVEGSEVGLEEATALLKNGWEPFSVNWTGAGHIIYFRKLAIVEDLD